MLILLESKLSPDDGFLIRLGSSQLELKWAAHRCQTNGHRHGGHIPHLQHTARTKSDSINISPTYNTQQGPYQIP